MAFETFDPKDLIVTVNDTVIEGFGETMLSISRPNPMFVQQVGATGHVCRVKTNDTSADVGFTIQQCSPSIDYLNQIATADEVQTKGVFTLKISYVGGTTPKELFFSSTAYIEKKPDATWSNSNQDREFMVKCAQSRYNLGVTSSDNHFFVDAQ